MRPPKSLIPLLTSSLLTKAASGGFSSGSRSSRTGSSIGSRGSRTYDQNGAKPIQQSATPKPATAPQTTPAGQAATTQPAPARQPSFLQRNPLLAGIAGGLAGSWLGHMLFGATESRATSNETGEPVDEPNQAAEASGSTGILLFLILLGAGTLLYFLKVRRPIPDFSGITRSSAVGGSLRTEPSVRTGLTSTVVSDVTAADKMASSNC